MSSNLAHEVSVRLKGRQLLEGKRLIAHEQEPLGGALSVRGYPEAIVSADEFIAGSIEYSYHLGRAMKPGDVGNLWRWPFRWRPKQVGMSPDWDIVLRGFVDYASRSVSPPEDPTRDPTERLPFIDSNFNIASTGVGISLFVKQNFSFRADFGMALTELRDVDLSDKEDEQIVLAKGNKEIHLISTFTW